MSKSETKSLPAYRIYSVAKGDNDKTVWQEIGAAWANRDGQGLNLSFKALPLPNAQIVLRKPKAASDNSKRKAA